MKTLKFLQSQHKFPTDKDNESHTFRGHSYLDVYDTIFPALRNAPGTFAEIGVLFGGSLRLFSTYFEGSAPMLGIDIDPARKAAESTEFGIKVETGSQNDPEFLGRIADQYGPFRCILDDGSHVVNHMLTTFRYLWPYISPGGIYIMEDIRISYYGADAGWPGMEYNPPSDLIGNERPMFDHFILELIKEMDHHRGDIRKIEFHPMIVAIHKV